jgi:hypothetical protein
MKESKDLPQSDARSGPVKRPNKERKCVNGNRSASHLPPPVKLKDPPAAKTTQEEEAAYWRDLMSWHPAFRPISPGG